MRAAGYAQDDVAGPVVVVDDQLAAGVVHLVVGAVEGTEGAEVLVPGAVERDLEAVRAGREVRRELPELVDEVQFHLGFVVLRCPVGGRAQQDVEVTCHGDCFRLLDGLDADGGGASAAAELRRLSLSGGGLVGRLALADRLGDRGNRLFDQLGSLVGDLFGNLGGLRCSLGSGGLRGRRSGGGRRRQRGVGGNGSSGVERCGERGRVSERDGGALAVLGDGPAGTALDQPACLDQLRGGGGQGLVAAGNAAAQQLTLKLVERDAGDRLAQHRSGVQLLVRPHPLGQNVQHGLQSSVGVFGSVRAHGSPLEAIDPPAFCQGWMRFRE